MTIVDINAFILMNSAMPMPQTTHPRSLLFALANASHTNAANVSMVPLVRKKFAHPNILHPAKIEVRSGIVHMVTGSAENRHATTSCSTEKDPMHVAATPRLSVASRSPTVEAKNSINPAKTQQPPPTSHSRWDRRSGGSKAQSMKKAAKPSGAFPRTSVEKNCRNASPAMTSMGLDAEAGETRMLVDSPGTLVAESILVGTTN